MKAILCAAALVTVGSIAHAEPAILTGHSAVVDPDTMMVTFSLRYESEPDFWTPNHPSGYAEDVFQIHTMGDRSRPYPFYYDATIRGGELPWTIDRIPIRAGNDTADARSGGWGNVIGSVPWSYDPQHYRFSFSVPVDLISQHHNQGVFDYMVSGSTTNGRYDFPFTSQIGVPEPSSFVIAAGTLLFAGLALQRQRRRCRQPGP